MTLRVLVPLLISAAILLAGNGLISTLVAIRADLEGFSGAAIGLMGTAYFAGYFGGSLLTAWLIGRAGHVRVFAALCASAALATQIMLLVIEPWVWILMRMLLGFAFSAVIMVVESWINESAGRGDRARILSIYRIVDLMSVTGGQFILPLVGADGFAIFVIGAMLFAASLIPVSLSRLSDPAPPERTMLRVGFLYALSPVAAVGCLTIGATNGAFRAMGPVYAQGMGLDVEQIAWFMSLGIFAGAVFQYPLGWLSDQVDRRIALIIATLGAAASSFVLSTFVAQWPFMIYAGAFLFGGFALPLYSLSIAHANDFAKPGQYVEVAAGLTLFYALGASVGPSAASWMMDGYGPTAFFLYTCALHLVFVGFVTHRMLRRAPVERALRARFVGLMRTSPALFRLSRTAAGQTPEDGASP